ncbi:MAG TPA: transglutaminase domain-containing protein [Kofleriaceae bacterium]|nr:transglutaminase domain-containing protein [Kofleriaceae bacterium]
MRRWFVALLAACASPPSTAPAPAAPAARPGSPGAAAELPPDAERHYAIWLGGAQVGTAREVERWSADGVTLSRSEAMRFLRGAAPVEIATAIEIVADRSLAPSRVTWAEASQASRRAEAVRDAAGWLVTGAAGVRRLPAGAIPAELAPLVVRRDGRFEGRVFFPARGFVVGAGRIEPVAERRLIAHLVLDPTGPGVAGPLAPAGSSSPAAPLAPATADATIDLGDDAMPVRVVDGEGVIAIRISAAAAAATFAPVDLIAATSIPLSGLPADPPSHRVALDGDLTLPPVPGQAVAAAGAPGPTGTIELELSPRLHGGLPPGPPGPDRTREIAALVRRVHARIAPDLAADPTSPHAAAAATSGDCTTFALAYAALAAGRAIPTLVVTGFRIDGDRLVRHRWAASWTGRAWIAVDAAFGAVPAGGDLVGLAVHDAGDVGLVAGDAALTRLRAAAWR